MVQPLFVFSGDPGHPHFVFGAEAVQHHGQCPHAQADAHQQQAVEDGQEIVLPLFRLRCKVEHLAAQQAEPCRRGDLEGQLPVELWHEIIAEEEHAHRHQAEAQRQAAHPAHRNFLGLIRFHRRLHLPGSRFVVLCAPAVDAVQDGLHVHLFGCRLVFGEVFFCRFGLRGALFCGPGAFDQPNAADDEHDADQNFRQLIHHQIERPEDRALLAPAPEQVAKGVHDDVLIGHHATACDEQPAQQFVPFGHQLFQTPVPHVKMDEVIVRRCSVQADLRPQIEGVEKAVHIKNGYADIKD